jgi:hypothetical protein
VDINGNADAGRSYVVFGKINSTAINLSSISAGTGGFAINGENNRDQSGLPVSSAGDVNGDGLDDLIIGAHGADIGNRTDAGKSYVVFGKTNTATINLSSIAAGTGGFVINGDYDRGYSGRSVSSAGDVDGDGFKSSKPSPLTSPAEETDLLIESPSSPMITKPPVPDSMADKSIALVSSFFPNTTKTLPVRIGFDPKAPITKSSKPSPLTSPAEETALSLLSRRCQWRWFR